MIGDVIFFKKKNTFISKTIARFTKSDFTHVGIIIEIDVDTGEFKIIESDRFIKTRVGTVQFDNASHTIYSIGYKTKEVEENIVKYANLSLGVEYDYLQVFGLFLSLIMNGNKYPIFNSSNKLICSELIDVVYLKSGVKRKNMNNVGNVTPQELLELYSFKMIERGGKEIVY